MKMIVELALSGGLLAMALGALPPAAVAAGAMSTRSSDEALLNRFLNSGQPRLLSYRALRRLEASTRGGRMAASLEAWTYVDAPGRFRFEVIRQDGSALILERVLVKALETEQQSQNNGDTGHAELSRANYDFEVRAGADDTALIGLRPRRRSPMLLNGTVTVKRDDGDMLRVDGTLSQRPSWWTRRVDIVRRYTRVSGVRVPVEMSSRADVRFVGDSSFSMTYDYTMINGQSVGQDVTTGARHAASNR